MRKPFFAILALGSVLAASCAGDVPPVPEEQMAAVLADLHLAEVRATQLPPDSNTAHVGRNVDSLAGFYAVVLHHHGLDTGTFRKAMDWYLAHPGDLDSVYKKSVVQVEQMIADPAVNKPAP